MIFTQWGDLIFSDHGMLCRLSDPTIQAVKHVDVPFDTKIWDVAMANGEMITSALDCLRLVQQLAGEQDWREWLERAARMMRDDRDQRIEWLQSQLVVNPESEE